MPGVGEKLDDNGLLIDFSLIKKELMRFIDLFDHSFLNDFKEIGNPTSENLSRYIYKNFTLPSCVSLKKVRVWESNNSYAEYIENY